MMAFLNPNIIYEDHLVKNPQIGLNYHISWARKRGMLWRLKRIENDIAYLETPKTKKPIKCKVSELRETNNRVNKNYIKRTQDNTKNKIKKYCPNCKKEWDGIECNNCGFDVSEVDIC